ADVSGFAESSSGAEMGGTGMVAVCGLTTNNGLGAGVTRRIEASPVVRAGVFVPGATGDVEWDTGCAGARFASTRSLF
ncbi:hypothetical protein OAM37_03390, partial [bacterium]|nr:hypothetical protein [bacterium]